MFLHSIKLCVYKMQIKPCSFDIASGDLMCNSAMILTQGISVWILVFTLQSLTIIRRSAEVDDVVCA